MQSATPVVLLQQVWPLPVSLAATSGISFDFSSSAYLDVSVQRVFLHTAILFTVQYWSIAPVGSPIRKSRDRWIFAPPPGLSQLVTSFFGSWCQGIRRMLFLAWPSIRTISRSPALNYVSKLLSVFLDTFAFLSTLLLLPFSIWKNLFFFSLTLSSLFSFQTTSFQTSSDAWKVYSEKSLFISPQT